MVLTVLPALPSEIKDVHDVLFAAMDGELILNFLFPGGLDRDAYDGAIQQRMCFDKNAHVLKCIDTESGEIVGMASYDIFWKPGDGWEKPAGVEWLQGDERSKSEKVIMPMFNIREQLWGHRRHIYIPWMAVDPKHQGRGAGRLLVQWGIDVAERLGLPIYLEALKMGYPVYNHMGFEQLTHVRAIHQARVTGASEDIEVPLMVKMPSAAKGLSFKEWSDKGYPEIC